MQGLSHTLSQIKPSGTLAVTARASELKEQGIDIISFSAGEPDFDTPEHIVNAAKVALDNGMTRYTPAAGLSSLRKAVADQHNKVRGSKDSAGNVIITVGAKHALYGFFQAILNPKDEVIIPAPYWVSYPDQVLLCGGVPKIVQTHAENNFRLTPQSLKAVTTDKTKVLVLNTPSNPTGAFYEKQDLQAIVDICVEAGIWICSDEIYRDLLYGGKTHTSVYELVPQDKRDLLFIVDGVSKTYAMTGWRIGWGIGHPDLIKAIAKIQGQSTSNPCSISQAAALAALNGPHDFLDEWKAQYQKRRDLICSKLEKMDGITCTKPDGAFYVLPNVEPLIAKLGKDKTDVDLSTYLIDKAQIAVVPGSAFGAPGHIRLSYATSLSNIEKGLLRLEQTISSL